MFKIPVLVQLNSILLFLNYPNNKNLEMFFHYTPLF